MLKDIILSCITIKGHIITFIALNRPNESNSWLDGSTLTKLGVYSSQYRYYILRKAF